MKKLMLVPALAIAMSASAIYAQEDMDNMNEAAGDEGPEANTPMNPAGPKVGPEPADLTGWSMDDTQKTAYDAWPPEKRTDYDAWPVTYRSYYWTLTPSQQNAYWVLTADQKAKIYAMTPEQRKVAWDAIEKQMTAAQTQPASAASASAGDMDDNSAESGPMTAPPTGAAQQEYPVCSATVKDSCINPRAARGNPR